ncbi:MAG: methyltransferase domain-containing protein [Firmicutes bacterium]|nr:methyltransferase domain-containing protein [Bacillota bacterium]
MKRIGIHKPTLEDVIEVSGVEMLHPGGLELTRRSAEIAGMQPGMKVLDVSSGRGTLAILYTQEYGVEVTGLDLSEEMIKIASSNALSKGLEGRVAFIQGDSQALPFSDNRFDVVINECAVGIPDDSQKVLDEMVRVVKPGGTIVIHESTWRKKLSDDEKTELSERYGTTPLEYDEWMSMLEKAGVTDIVSEFEEWSKPEMFWKLRAERDVRSFSEVLTLSERLTTFKRILGKYGIKGVIKAAENEKIVRRTILEEKVGYCLFKGIKG